MDKFPSYTLERLKALNTMRGDSFFAPATMRFFRSRIAPKIFPGGDGWYFVTSEQFDYESPRLYTVRRMNADGETASISEFQEYKTLRRAYKRAEFEARESLEIRLDSQT